MPFSIHSAGILPPALFVLNIFMTGVTHGGTPQVPLLLHATHARIKGVKTYLVSLLLSNTEYITYAEEAVGKTHKQNLLK